MGDLNSHELRLMEAHEDGAERLRYYLGQVPGWTHDPVGAYPLEGSRWAVLLDVRKAEAAEDDPDGYHYLVGVGRPPPYLGIDVYELVEAFVALPSARARAEAAARSREWFREASRRVDG